MITGRPEKEYILTAAQEGDSSYIIKAFDTPTLEVELNKIVN